MSGLLPAGGASSDKSLDDKTFAFLLRSIRRHGFRLYKSLRDNLLRQFYALMTSILSARIIHWCGWFSYAPGSGREHFEQWLDTGNVRKFMNATVVTVMGLDMEFHEKAPRLVPCKSVARSVPDREHAGFDLRDRCSQRLTAGRLFGSGDTSTRSRRRVDRPALMPVDAMPSFSMEK